SVEHKKDVSSGTTAQTEVNPTHLDSGPNVVETEDVALLDDHNSFEEKRW
ncbi:hypothetical protein KI387_020720, partial [Taxus chinensis]